MSGRSTRRETAGAPPGGLTAVIHEDGFAHHVIQTPHPSKTTIAKLDENGEHVMEGDEPVYDIVDGPPLRDHHGQVIYDEECAEHLLPECADCGGREEDHPVEFVIGGKRFVYCEKRRPKEECPCDLPRHRPE